MIAYYVASSIVTVIGLLLLMRGRARFDDVCSALVLGFAGGWLLWPLLAAVAITRRGA